MDADLIRREIALLEREIAVIRHELSEARRDSVRAVLRQELEEKEAERSNLSSQIDVNMGNSNDFSSGNMTIGSTVGNDLNQYTQNNGVNASGATFGDSSIVAGQNIYIYPNDHILKNRTPIDLKIYLEALLSKRIESTTQLEGWIFKREVTVPNDIWDKNAPFKTIAEIKDSVTKEIKYLGLYEGLLNLEDTSDFVPIKTNWASGTDKKKFIKSKAYIASRNNVIAIRNSVLSLLGKLSQDGYDVDEHILDFNESITYNYHIDVYREAYKAKHEGYDENTHNTYPELRLRSGKHKIDIFSEIITRRKNF